MSIFRCVILVSLVSLLAGLGLVFLGSSSGYEQFRGGYAVIATDISTNGRTIGGLLETSGSVFWGAPVYESNQWVMLDVFGDLEKIPLDQYSSRLLSSDPRNDGYADKLKNVFVQNDKRLFYIPLLAGNWNLALLDRQFENLLKEIPFTVEYYGIGKPVFLFFASFAAASLCFIILCYAKKQRNSGSFMALIPALSSLVFFGTPGIVCAALLFGFFFLFKEPLNDLVSLPALFKKQELNQKYNNQLIVFINKEIIKPYRLHFVFLPVFAVTFGVLIIISQVKLLFFILVFLAALAVFIISLKIISGVSWSRRRFNPVLIIKRRAVDFSFYPYIMPFAAAAFIVMFLTPNMPGAYNPQEKFDALVDEKDYYAHLSFQASFSIRQFGASAFAYPDYKMGADGLPVPSGDSFLDQLASIDGLPPFPLKHLMDFFNGISLTSDSLQSNDGGESIGSPDYTKTLPEKLSLLILLFFILAGLLIKKRKKDSPKIDLSNYKKSTGKPRFFGINRISLLGNSLQNSQSGERIPKQVRKDA
ncbi:MAG: hypothetical protein LBU66_07835 [Treponema sp.]|jgi:hypothetical protein|nr:hypothetical protein [Treponema sp.]